MITSHRILYFQGTGKPIKMLIVDTLLSQASPSITRKTPSAKKKPGKENAGKNKSPNNEEEAVIIQGVVYYI